MTSIERQVTRRIAMCSTLFVRVCAFLAVFGLVAVMANPVSAGKPEKVIVDESFDEVLCGVPVHTTITGFEIFHIQEVVIEPSGPDSDEFWIGVINTHLTFMSTNAAGVTLTETDRFTRQEGSFVNNGDGTWTYTFAVNGKPIDLRSGKEHVLVEVGRITFEEVIFLGDLSTAEDNFFVSGEITSVSGPHPQAESDFTLFCEVVNDVLG
jgi:hypothetical protein